MFITWKFATTTIIQCVVVLLYIIVKTLPAIVSWGYGDTLGKCYHL